MAKIWKGITGLILLLPLAVLAGCGGSKLVAKVDGEPITQEEFYRALQAQPIPLQTGMTPAGPLVLYSLITDAALDRKAGKSGVRVTEEEINKRLEQAKDDTLASGLTWEEFLQQNFSSEEDLKRQIRANLILTRLSITDKDRKEFYEKQQQDLAKDPSLQEAVLVRRIVVPMKQEAETIRKQVLEGKAIFVKAAREKSQDPYTRGRGGMIGWITKGQLPAANAEFEKTIFALKPVEMSQPLEMKPPAPAKGEKPLPSQWQIILLERKRPAREATFENLEDLINRLLLQEKQTEVAEFRDSLLTEAQVEIMDPLYSALGTQLKQMREARVRQLQPQMPGGEGPLPGQPQVAPPKAPPAKGR